MKKLSILFAVILMTGCAGMQGSAGSSGSGGFGYNAQSADPTRSLYFGA
jgi:uncharacterized protein YceK